ncbi:hypothetical protein HNW77_03880 [Komagataeibacter sp. AV436]|uniref:Uncharacterized protein n=1 Tax=Komagataeibacter melomenusus TaxID=2766578 RepID=A0ABX2ACI4_9PROT|nr:hypothetical protein [Komagataeibacter melomenusus]MBV1830137.1 hypothetical protein [Komagataeibacter melomenusus]NPC65556.1 hypothetical protein [Komagataeibacter melomenusus]
MSLEKAGFSLPGLGRIASETCCPIPEELKARLLSVAVPTLSAIMFKMGLHTRFFSDLHPLQPACRRFCGPAWTVRAMPVREDIREGIAQRQVPSLNRMALDAAPADSVVVVGSGGHPEVSFMGDIMATSLMVRGIAGVILDTSVSDVSIVGKMELPVVCAGRNVRSSFSALMVIGCDEPVGVQGVAVFPGDIIVGDEDGAVCVPRHLADEIADAAIEQEALEAFIIKKVATGMPIDIAYPPSPQILAEYEQWRATQEKTT